MDTMESPRLPVAGIKNIVFDLGGVVIDLDREAAVAALSELGLRQADAMLGLYRQEEPFLGLETGRVTAAGFFDRLRPLCGGASDSEIADAFCKFLVNLPVCRLERLRELRRAGFRLYVLSNTNPVMFDSWIRNAFRAEGARIADYFDGIVASYNEGICKPDVDIFRRVLDRFHLDPARTLMLDDSPANCEAAARAGMHVIRVGSDPDRGMMALTGQLLDSVGAYAEPVNGFRS